MPPATAVQADLPAGARALDNPVGSAPGVLVEVGPAVVLAVPGVPRELEAMVAGGVLPELRARAGLPPAVATRQLRVAVLGESLVAERLTALESALPEGVRLAYLAAPGDVRVRFTGLDVPLLESLRERAAVLLGDVVSGYDDETLPRTLLRLLLERRATVATAESLTGGAVAATLVDVPGISAVFRGGVVAYATDLKTALLDVPASGLAATGAVHEDVARAMAVGVRERLGADWGLATTGVAGPDPQDGVAAGTVVVAVAGPHEGDVAVRRLELRGDRASVRALSVVHVLDLLRRRLQGLESLA
jgi:nicotinamide-nucleotide amidase